MVGTHTHTVLAGATSEMTGKIGAFSESRGKGETLPDNTKLLKFKGKGAVREEVLYL